MSPSRAHAGGSHGKQPVGYQFRLRASDQVRAVFQRDQPHEGAAFVEGRKVFLRTELIFEFSHGEELAHDVGIARTFAKACYFTGESVFAPELRRHTHDLYEPWWGDGDVARELSAGSDDDLDDG